MSIIFKSKLLKNTSENYSGKDISILTGIEACRKRVSYYLGSSDSNAIYQLLKEAVDNCIDEYQAGKNTFVGVELEGNQIIVYDKGRGIPVDIHPKTGKPTILGIFQELHSGGKFGSKAYKHSAGVHGVGITATNALSKKMEVWTRRDNKWYNIVFEKGQITTKLNTKTPPPKLSSKIEQGTILRFTPDFSRFDEGSKLSIKKVRESLDFASYIHGGLKIYLKTPKNEYNFIQKEGLLALLTKRIEAVTDLEMLSKPLRVKTDSVDLALCWTASPDENTQSYVSGSFTSEGGTHLTGLYKALNDAIKPYKGKKEFTPADLRSGLYILMNVGVKEPQFSSQSKERLTSDYVTDEVYQAVKPELDKYFKSNKAMVKRIVEQASEVNKLYSKLKADKKTIADFNKTGRGGLPSKLASSRTKNPEEREIFLVEGDSAAGFSKQARNNHYQEVLPLRGKIVNAYKKEGLKVLENKVAKDIFQAIGYDPSGKSEKLRVGRIIFFCDPDVDGYHITLLLLALFQRVLPKAFVDKKIFFVDAPLFTAKQGSKTIYAATRDDLITKLGGKIPPTGITRLKGWGEANVTQIREVAFNKATRKLVRITDPSKKEMVEFAKIMGEDTEYRREFLIGDGEEKEAA